MKPLAGAQLVPAAAPRRRNSDSGQTIDLPQAPSDDPVAALGQVAHYVFADGSGGFLIADESALERLYEDALSYSPYLALETRPVLSIDDAVPQITGWLGG